MSRSELGSASVRAGGPSSTITPPSMNNNAIPDIARKRDLVGDDDHRHPLLGELADYPQHLADELGIERARHLVE